MVVYMACKLVFHRLVQQRGRETQTLPRFFLGNSQKPQTLRYAPSAKCSFTKVNSAFALVASLDFGVSMSSLYFFTTFAHYFRLKN
jgi:hypothetical protein